MKIGNQEFDTASHTYVMGILNMTPDSFSDGGKWNKTDAALRHVEEMISEGAAVIDVGGESTRPGFETVSDEEEIARVTPIITKVKSEFNIPISLDTYKSAVAAAGIQAGADMINDIWGLRHDADMASLIAGNNVSCCLMHNRSEATADELMKTVLSDLEESVHMAEAAGIARERILLDPGIGFGKTYEQNLRLLHDMEELHMFGYPLLLGASRKSVVGLTLDLPVEERLEGTLVTTVLAVMKRYSFVRVHDVKEHVRAIRMAEAIRDCM
ncbi:MAG: dihydropteroate synthase [Lachnospiraceae bacterium]|nr:dihydropteroate synthase [Lachnospiraceae bacterium]